MYQGPTVAFMPQGTEEPWSEANVMNKNNMVRNKGNGVGNTDKENS